MDKAVILTSGGINSAVAAAVSREHYEPALLHIAWGHRSAEREREAFEAIASALGIEQIQVADLGCLAGFGGNARTVRRMAIEDAATLAKGTPATYAAGVLPTMLSTAAAWASTLHAKRIILGISEDHGVPGPAVGELYPDHRIEFTQTFNLMLQYATPADCELTVETPLIELSRADVVQLGRRMSVPFEKTWSCYARNDKPCGRCRPCATRTAGFLAARIPDPLTMQEPAKTA